LMQGKLVRRRRRSTAELDRLGEDAPSLNPTGGWTMAAWVPSRGRALRAIGAGGRRSVPAAASPGGYLAECATVGSRRHDDHRAGDTPAALSRGLRRGPRTVRTPRYSERHRRSPKSAATGLLTYGTGRFSIAVTSPGAELLRAARSTHVSVYCTARLTRTTDGRHDGDQVQLGGGGSRDNDEATVSSMDGRRRLVNAGDGRLRCGVGEWFGQRPGVVGVAVQAGRCRARCEDTARRRTGRLRIRGPSDSDGSRNIA